MDFSGKSILIVDDDVEIRATLHKIVNRVGFKVYEAEDGISAKTILDSVQPDVILSDIRMPRMTGVELLASVKDKGSTIPFILMTGFSDIIEAQQAFKLGAANFLSKPFGPIELLDTLRNILAVVPSEPLSSAQSHTEFCRVPLEDFTAGSKLRVDIYVRLSDEKHLRVAKESFELSAERVESYKAKGLKFFYIRKEEFPMYVGLNIQVSKIASDAQKLTGKQKFKVLKHATESILQESFINGINADKFGEAKGMLNMTLDVIGQDPDMVSLIDSLNSTADHLYAHGLGVSLYSTLIAEEVGWTSTTTKFKVSMGGLLHDIGKRDLDPAILEKPRNKLDRNELKLYETHPIRGKEILENIKNIPSEVAIIALQHHENCLGQGYPAQLTAKQIHPFAKLVSVANRFCELILKNPNSEGISPQDAIDKIISLNADEFDIIYVEALMRIFGHAQTHASARFKPRRKSS